MLSTEILKKYFGYDKFRPGQEEIITAILNHQDTLAVMPTGAGKSICYQVPAMLLPGITIVISPLISLMQDQVKALNAAGIHAAYINSSLSESQIAKALQLASAGAYKIIYAAPERLESYLFQQFASKADISMVTVDEAHCISQWGQDFRPSYLKIVEFIRTLHVRPVISAFTATATEEVKEDIRCILGLNNPKVLVTGFDRPNLYYEVDAVRRKDDFVLEYIKQHLNDSGIVYCATRKNVDHLFELLFKSGVSVTKYHAGMASNDRKKNQEDFVYDRAAVMIATNAFGMGIDKSNVRFVIHYNMPQSMENYYQEAGRAGRDGEDSKCILLYSPQDVVIDKMLLERKDFTAVDPDDIENIRYRDQQRLRIMENYCQTTDCLRTFILNYFGEKTDAPCDNCANCRRHFQEIDVTKEAKWIINCAVETRGRFGVRVVAGILTGANRARLKEIGAFEYRSYGILKDTSEIVIRQIITQMVQQDYLVLTEGQYSVLKAGPKAMELQDDSVRVIIRVHEEKERNVSTARNRSRTTDYLTSLGYQLFEALRGLRTEIAREANLPPYIVFTDKTLIDMCLKLPATRAEMLSVSGVAAVKYDKYGERFLEEINAFTAKYPDQVISTYPEADDASEAESKRKKKKRKKKPEFFLNPEDADNFKYAEYYFISDIRDALNAANTTENRKKIPATKIAQFLESEELITEVQTDSGYRKLPTEKGIKAGIRTVERVSQSGMPYTLLQYPENVQHLIVKYFSSQAYYDSIQAEDGEADDSMSV